MKKLLTTITLAAAGIIGFGATASAHHTTIQCSNPETSTWSIINSENLNMTFTTDQGHTGSIGPNGTAFVVYEGTSLRVSAKWSNRVVNTNTGQGNCIPTPTTTEPPPETTEPEVPDTTVPEVPETTTPEPEVPDTTVPSATPPTTETPGIAPPLDPTCLLWNEDGTYSGDSIPQGEWESTDRPTAEGTANATGHYCRAIPADPPVVPPAAPELPSTGGTTTMAIIAAVVLAGGVAARGLARR